MKNPDRPATGPAGIPRPPPDPDQAVSKYSDPAHWLTPGAALPGHAAGASATRPDPPSENAPASDGDPAGENAPACDGGVKDAAGLPPVKNPEGSAGGPAGIPRP
ncbi:hypothetical protein ACFWFF_40620, partial [Streptomyces sp. NPDC060223]